MPLSTHTLTLHILTDKSAVNNLQLIIGTELNIAKFKTSLFDPVFYGDNLIDSLKVCLADLSSQLLGSGTEQQNTKVQHHYKHQKNPKTTQPNKTVLTQV